MLIIGADHTMTVSALRKMPLPSPLFRATVARHNPQEETKRTRDRQDARPNRDAA